MYSQELIERLTGLLAPKGFTPRNESEAHFPDRALSDGAEVMRVPPSPTGFVHIGTIYAGLVNERIAHQTKGVFILRIEDTDKKREVEGSTSQIVQAFKEFELNYDEGPDKEGAYGPYFQSERGRIYMGYAIELLQKGRAYPCFASPEELQESIKDQQSKKLRPGYYGDWALWREKTEDEIISALNTDKPFVLRFRSEGSHGNRIQYQDVFKGKMEVPENDLDVPLIKSDEYRLPTYHLAHVVDDYLMRVTKVFRSDEWLPSTALHIELAQTLGIAPFTYGHFAPISIIDKSGGKRKLSKRKDEEADVQYWLRAGYPIEAIKAYLLGLANSNFEDWYRSNPDKPLVEFQVSLEKLAASRAPLLDMAKLEDYAKDYIARLSQEEFNQQILEHADESFRSALEADGDYTNRVLSIERDGDKPRKDLSQWSQAKDQYGYFFDDLFLRDTELLSDLEPAVIANVTQVFLSSYNPEDSLSTWLEKMRAASEQQEMNMRDFARILRVKLTGKNRTPDLYAIMQVMGDSRVRERLI
jgi:glutamyl-tRNA synthetase